ncbi:ATP-binding protein [Streptomyces sp. 2MCAF27]
MRPSELSTDCSPRSGVLTVRASLEAPRSARTFTRDILAQEAPDLARGLLEDMLVIVSELVTNAVRYGTDAGETILVVVLVSTELVRVEVHDHSRRHPRPKRPGNHSHGGRGLAVVDAFATCWGVEDQPGGKAIWAEVKW